MSSARALTLACLLAIPLAASAQWMYLDKDGRKVFSDKPPPPDVPAKNILKQPGGRSFTEAAPAAAPASAPAATAAASPKVTGKDKDLEAKRGEKEAAEAQKKKEEADKLAKLRAENCAQAKQTKATLDSGVRIVRANDKGENEIIDDKQRAAEVKRVQDIMATECQQAAAQ